MIVIDSNEEDDDEDLGLAVTPPQWDRLIMGVFLFNAEDPIVDTWMIFIYIL